MSCSKLLSYAEWSFGRWPCVVCLTCFKLNFHSCDLKFGGKYDRLCVYKPSHHLTLPVSPLSFFSSASHVTYMSLQASLRTVLLLLYSLSFQLILAFQRRSCGFSDLLCCVNGHEMTNVFTLTIKSHLFPLIWGFWFEMILCHFLHDISFHLQRCPEEHSIEFVHAYVWNVLIIYSMFFVYGGMTHICMYRYTKLIKLSVYAHVRGCVYRQMCMEA